MNSAGRKALSVGELSDILKACFQNPAFRSLAVYGEVYSLRRGKFSYLEIGDPGRNEVSSPLLKCAFRTLYGDSYGLADVKVGDIVEIRGALSYYAHGSSVTLWGEEIEIRQEQMGRNLLRKRKTLEKLEGLGYLDASRKRSLPSLCRRIAIVTAYPSAAYEDILKTLHERFPVDTVLFPATVQGEEAAHSLLSALEKARKQDFDALILGRGGGSKTDLSAFDDEKLAMAIATYPCPVITCIGHTIDTSIADRVSDISAITPTEGASYVNPRLEDVRRRWNDLGERLKAGFQALLDSRQLSLDALRTRLSDLSPYRRLKAHQESLRARRRFLAFAYTGLLQAFEQKRGALLAQLRKAMQDLLLDRRERLLSLQALFRSLDPKLVGRKGYAVVFKGGEKVFSSGELQEGDVVTITFADGRRTARIQEDRK